MIIRRDAMAHVPHAASIYAASAAAPTSYPSPPLPIQYNQSPSPDEHLTTATINKLASQEDSQSTAADSDGDATSQAGAIVPSQLGTTALNPSQQREAMQKATWDREKKQLLKKATNSQGDSVERLLANYLAV